MVNLKKEISMMALVQNSMLSFNVLLLLCVLHFSFCEDGKAAVLSYVSLALIVLMTKYVFCDNCICASVVNFIGFVSKIMIIGGILLAMLPRFWNTAFYLVCLGIFILKMKCEIQSRVGNACSNMNLMLLNDTKDEFKPIIPQKSAIQSKNCSKETLMGQENKIKDSDKIDNDALFRITTEQRNKANELEKTCEDKAALPQNYWNRLPLNFPEIVNHVSVKDLLKQSNKNLNKNYENTEVQSNIFIKQEKIFESIYGIRGSSLLNMKNPQELALTEMYPSNIKLELKQIEERNYKFTEKPTASNDTTQKKNIYRDDILKQLDIIANMLQKINWQKIEMRNELSNAQESINSHIQQEAMKTFSSSNLFQQNLGNVKDKFHQKSVRSFDDEVNLLIFNKSINLDVNEQPQKSNKMVKGTNSETDTESLASKIDFKRENCSEADKTSNPKANHTRLASVKSTDIQHENETCSRQLKSISEQITENVNLKTISTKSDSKVFPVSEKSLESNVLTNSCMNVDFDSEVSNGSELDNSAGNENWVDEHARKPTENVGETHSQTNVEGAVNRIDLRFIYDVGF